MLRGKSVQTTSQWVIIIRRQGSKRKHKRCDLSPEVDHIRTSCFLLALRDYVERNRRVLEQEKRKTKQWFKSQIELSCRFLIVDAVRDGVHRENVTDFLDRGKMFDWCKPFV